MILCLDPNICDPCVISWFTMGRVYSWTNRRKFHLRRFSFSRGDEVGRLWRNERSNAESPATLNVRSDRLQMVVCQRNCAIMRIMSSHYVCHTLKHEDELRENEQWDFNRKMHCIYDIKYDTLMTTKWPFDNLLLELLCLHFP